MCFNTHTSLNPCNGNPSESCGGCLTLGTITKSSCVMNLCGTTDTLEIDFSCFCFPCTTPVFEVLNTSELTKIDVVSIDKNKLVVRAKGAGYIEKQSIRFTATCGTGCDTKSDYGTVNIHFRSACFGKELAGKICDPCTGILTDGPVDIVIGAPASDSQTDITIG
jgi:hypothetical protein